MWTKRSNDFVYILLCFYDTYFKNQLRVDFLLVRLHNFTIHSLRIHFHAKIFHVFFSRFPFVNATDLMCFMRSRGFSTYNLFHPITCMQIEIKKRFWNQRKKELAAKKRRRKFVVGTNSSYRFVFEVLLKPTRFNSFKKNNLTPT